MIALIYIIYYLYDEYRDLKVIKKCLMALNLENVNVFMTFNVDNVYVY